ncbi:hypothetical protein [Paractinoplanes brasiliensis]|uniref:Uncharacterized protein n=1 Tax=Paractinoplanes brasiliensis TaxID=52695 RepID=A0A4R6K1H6_9ACTN|nr:hypothetical protein [Actinoplanes brasiliensis]TDO42142.1 hypothetical protein C8E87_5906 [Actinoplanes brasiliensis]GID31993.1 hypothetical protein Abr02nite_69760 [Actinoplanes brasiliensis]
MWISGGAYHAWSTFLDQWGGGAPIDPATLPPLAREDLAADTWARLMNQITAAMDRRLGAWSDTLARELGNARDEFAAARALDHARWGLPAIRALAAAPGLPEDVRGQLTGLVDNQIRSTQKQIDEAVQRMRRSGVPAAAVEARLRTVRDNPLTAVLGPNHATGGGWDTDPTVTPRRRVTF